MPSGRYRRLLSSIWKQIKSYGPIGAVGLVVLRRGWLLSLPSPFRIPVELMNDYGNTRRYAAENQKLPAPAATESRIVFMGDSITDFWGRGPLALVAPFFPGKPYINRGITGQITAQMILRFYPDVIALQPEAVVLLAGINDICGNLGPVSNESVQNNLMVMADLARAHHIKIVLASVLPVCDYHYPQRARKLIGRILALNEWLNEYAARNHDVYLDYFSATVDESGFLKADLTDDGLHPNATGYAVMAPLAERAIAEALHGRSPAP